MTTSAVPVVWSFFTGAMGLDLGLEQHGFKPSLAVELDPVICRTIASNRPGHRVAQANVGSLDARALRALGGADDVDLMVGGPPCQSFCPGGKRSALSDPRGNLIFEYLRLVGEVRPRRFVLENVAGLISAAIRHRPITQRPGRSWNLASYSRPGQQVLPAPGEPLPLEPDEQSGSAIRLLLETAVAELGYHVEFGVLDASRFGAAQRRYRFVLVGDRDAPAPPLPEPTHGFEDGLEPGRTVRDAIEDLADDPGPGSRYTADVQAVFDLVPEGGNWRSLPRDVAERAMGERSYRAGGGKTGFFRRLAWDQPSPTITGKANRKGSAMCHPASTRPLSVRECARLQGFPDDWSFVGSMHQQYLQIGNAVPTALGAAVGQMLISSPRETSCSHDDLLARATEVVRASARNRQARALAA